MIRALLITACMAGFASQLAGEETPTYLMAADSETAESFETISQSLDTRVDWDFHEIPLEELLEEIRTSAKIHITLDRRPLEDAGVMADTLLSVRAPNLRLREALRLVLKDLEDCTFVIENGTLLITTASEADNRIEARVYPVRDLVVDAKGHADFNNLMDTIESAVAADSWMSVGGRGVLAPVPSSATLVVSQTQEVHEQLVHLLEALRAARKLSGGSPVAVASENRVTPKPNHTARKRAARPKFYVASPEWLAPKKHE